MQEITDDILTKASQGDVGCFKEIYKAAGGFVYNVAFRVVGSKEDAEEVTQEVFLTLHRKLKEFRFQSSFKTWVYRITVNHAINYAKKAKKDRHNAVEYDKNLNAVPVAAQARADMEQKEKEHLVKTLLSNLNPDQRACVVLRNIEGLSYQEIAASLGININTVRSRLKRAREALMTFGKEVVNHEL